MKKKILLIIASIVVIALAILVIPNINRSYGATDYNSNDLVLGTFFTADYPYSNGTTSTTVDERINLYTSSTPSSMDYIGETGLLGRDARVLYKNGVYYMATTKGGSSKGGYAFRIYKSTDLINWTDDSIFPYAFSYDIGTAVGNKYGLPVNTWGPKWVEDGNNEYLIISSSRFDSSGNRLYYYKNWNNLTEARTALASYVTNYSTSLINSNFISSKAVMIVESAVLSNGRSQICR